MPRRQQLRVDHGAGGRQERGQVVVVGDDQVHAARAGVLHRLVGVDAGVAGDNQLHAVVDQALQPGQVDAMPLLGAQGDVKTHLPAQAAQRLHQQRGCGLAIHIEIAPDGDALAGVDGPLDAFDGLRHAGQVKGRGWGVARRVQEGAGAVDIGHTPLRQDARHQRMAADGLAKGWGNGEGGGFEPGGHVPVYHGLPNDCKRRIKTKRELFSRRCRALEQLQKAPHRAMGCFLSCWADVSWSWPAGSSP